MRERTVGTTVCVGRGGIAETVIAFFTGVDLAVSARTGSEAAVSAIIRQSRIEGGLLALFAKQFLHKPVAADADLHETGGVATVAVPAVGVITLFRRFQNAIAANGCSSHEVGSRAATVLTYPA